MGVVTWFINKRLNQEAKKEGSMFKSALDWLSGKKTYILAAATLLGTIGKVLGEHQAGQPIDWTGLWEGITASGVIASIRAAITKSSVK